MSDVLPLRAAPIETPKQQKPERRNPKPLVTDARRLAKELLVADARRLAKALGMGLRTIRTLDAAGKLPKPIRIGGRVVWRMKEIRAWLAAGAPDRETWAAMCDAQK